MKKPACGRHAGSREDMHAMQGTATRDTGGVDSGYAWARLGLSMFLATIGGAGMWSVVVVLPAVEREFGVTIPDSTWDRCTTVGLMIDAATGRLP